MTPWKIYIMDEAYRTGRVQDGIVQFLGDPKGIHAPDGWQDINIAWERNMTRYGTMRNFSLKMGFVLDGATILRDGLYRSNVDKKLYLLIQKRVIEIDGPVFRDYYKYFYKGQFDFSTADDKQGDRRFEINILEGGLWKALKAKEDTQYTIEFDDQDGHVNMDGLELFGKQNYVIIEQEYVALAGIRSSLTMAQTTREGNAPGAAFFDQQREDDPGTDTINYFLETAQVGYYTITGEITARIGGVGTAQVDIALRPLDGAVDIEIATGTLTPSFQAIPLDYTFVSAPGRKYILLIKVFGIQAFVAESNIAINFRATHPPSTRRIMHPYRLFQKLVGKITGSQDNAYSDILQTSTYHVTSGDAIRGIASAVIKTSLKDFFTAFNVYHMLGMGVENNKIRIEARAHFFQSGNPIDCGSTKDFGITPASDLMFSKIKVGHAEQDIDDVNGKFAFNGIHHYGSPIEAVSEELDLVSPYKADPYEIETLRANLDGKTTTDSGDDNSVFVMDVIPSVNVFTEENVVFYFQNDMNIINQVQQDRPMYVGMKFTTDYPNNPGPFTIKQILSGTPGYKIWVVEESVTEDITTTVTFTITSGANHILNRNINVTAGVPAAASVFNVGLTPARLIRVHGAWIRGVLEGYQGEVLQFNSTNRNYDLVAGGIIERANIPVSELAAPMISPWYFDYGTQVPISLVDELETDQNRSFSGIDEGRPFEGFCIKTGLAPNTRQEQSFKLLAVPGTDITKFIT